MLTIEVRNAAQAASGTAEVEVFCDSKGLDLLMKQLNFLRAGSSHVHLMTPAWAGNELDEKTFGQDAHLIHHLRINMIPSSGSGQVVDAPSSDGPRS